MTVVRTKEKAEKVSVASKKKEYRGLCSTCNNASTCIYPRDSKRPVLQCEEFDGYAVPPDRTTVNGILAKSRSQVTSGAEVKDSVEYKGLCRNCENRKTCTFPKPEEGVWHCEEYE
jgi:hypothetical protein